MPTAKLLAPESAREDACRFVGIRQDVPFTEFSEQVGDMPYIPRATPFAQVASVQVQTTLDRSKFRITAKGRLAAWQLLDELADTDQPIGGFKKLLVIADVAQCRCPDAARARRDALRCESGALGQAQTEALLLFRQRPVYHISANGGLGIPAASGQRGFTVNGRFNIPGQRCFCANGRFFIWAANGQQCFGLHPAR